MKIFFLFKASSDNEVNNNAKRVIEHLRGLIGHSAHLNLLSFSNDTIIEDPKKSILEHMDLTNRAHNEVNIVAHGNGRNEILISRGVDEPFAGINPKKLADFFQNYAFENNQFKFSKLILYACETKEFGKQLSELIPNVEINCFEKDIYLKDKINISDPTKLLVYENAETETITSPFTFLNGRIISNEEKENVSSSTQPQATSNNIDIPITISNNNNSQQSEQKTKNPPTQYSSNALDDLINANLNDLLSRKSNEQKNEEASLGGLNPSAMQPRHRDLKIIKDPQGTLHELANTTGNSNTNKENPDDDNQNPPTPKI